MTFNSLERILMVAAAFVLWTSEARATDGRFGVVEIGGSGVKASIVRLSDSSSSEGYGGVDLVVEREYPTRNANAVYPEQAQAVAQVVGEDVRAMRAVGVSALRIYVVGSSGLAR
jgi:hypothetical protein